jgi:hypothetical protein
VIPHSRQPRQQVFKLRQFDLQLGFRGSGSQREDVDDQFRAVHHADTQRLLELLPLHRAEILVEDDEGRSMAQCQRSQFLYLARTDVERGVRRPDLLLKRRYDLGAGGVRQRSQFIEMIGRFVAPRTPLGSADEDRALDRGLDFDESVVDDSLILPSRI